MSVVGMVTLALGSITESKTNPRKRFDEQALSDLAASIKEKGVLQPVLVRPGKKKDTFELVAGARRFRATKLAGLSEVPAIVRELNDTEVIEVQVIENLQREDVHPIEEAEGYAQLIKSGGYTEAAIAEKIGKSHTYVHRRLGLARLEPKPKEAFQKELITISHAILISKLDSKVQVEALEAVIGSQEKGKPLRVTHWDGKANPPSQLKSWIANNIYMGMGHAPFDLDDAELLPVAGACATCPKRTSISAALFPEFEGEDRCTDRKCWSEKIEANALRVQEKFKAEGKELPLLSNEWSNAPTGTIPDSEWERYRPRAENTTCPRCEGEGVIYSGEDDDEGADCDQCAGTGEVMAPPADDSLPDDVRVGMMVDGHNRGQLVHFRIRETGGASASSTPAITPSERDEAERKKKADRREELRVLRAENLARQRIYEACVTEIDSGRTLIEGPIASALVLKVLQHNKCDSAARAKYPGPKGYEVRKPFDSKSYGYGHRSETPTVKDLAKVPTPGAALTRLALDAIAIDEISVHDYHRPSGFALLAFAEALGIDVELIRKEADWDCLSKSQQKQRMAENTPKPESKSEKPKEPAKTNAKAPAKPKAKAPAKTKAGAK